MNFQKINFSIFSFAIFLFLFTFSDFAKAQTIAPWLLPFLDFKKPGTVEPERREPQFLTPCPPDIEGRLQLHVSLMIPEDESVSFQSFIFQTVGVRSSDCIRADLIDLYLAKSSSDKLEALKNKINTLEEELIRLRLTNSSTAPTVQ